MLYDRMCPGGGWNAGNGVVYGMALAPHPDVTAITVLALLGERSNNSITASLNWLEHRTESILAPWSLAWATLALQAYRRPIQLWMDRLCTVAVNAEIRECATLAVVCMALECASSPDASCQSHED